jgi:hypothetical protein
MGVAVKKTGDKISPLGVKNSGSPERPPLGFLLPGVLLHMDDDSPVDGDYSLRRGNFPGEEVHDPAAAYKEIAGYLPQGGLPQRFVLIPFLKKSPHPLISIHILFL